MPARWFLWRICIGNGIGNSLGLCLAFLGTDQVVLEGLTDACGELGRITTGYTAAFRIGCEPYVEGFGEVHRYPFDLAKPAAAWWPSWWRPVACLDMLCPPRECSIEY